jgi:hypothetical protein
MPPSWGRRTWGKIRQADRRITVGTHTGSFAQRSAWRIGWTAGMTAGWAVADMDHPPSFQCGEEFAELGCGLELRDRLQVLERGRESIVEAPDRTGSELLVLGVEVEFVNPPGEMPRCVEIALNECFVDDELRIAIRELGLSPSLDVGAHGFEVPLHPVNADCEGVGDDEVLRVLVEDGGEVAVESEIIADENSEADGHGKPHGLIVRIADAEGESASFETVVEFEDSEEFHAVV